MKHLIVFIATLLMISLAESSVATNIEHQIRLCDTKQSIARKLHLDQASSVDLKNKKYQVFYLDTKNRNYASLNFSIRIRLKSNKTEITIKKKAMESEHLDSKYPNMICEYDLHGPRKDYACKIDANVPNQDFENVLKNNKNWIELLDSEQFNFLKQNNALFKDAVVFGTLADQRIQWNDNILGLVTLDLISQVGHDENTFHEISIRYPADSDKSIGIQFENFIKSTQIKRCENQVDWPINKFDILDILN